MDLVGERIGRHGYSRLQLDVTAARTAETETAGAREVEAAVEFPAVIHRMKCRHIIYGHDYDRHFVGITRYNL